VILAGRSTNDGMGRYIATEALKCLLQGGIEPKDCVVTVLGIAFKENIADIRNSKVVDIVRELEKRGVEVQVTDPRVAHDEVATEYGINLKPLDKLQGADLVVFAVPHREFVNLGWSGILQCLRNQQGFVFDVKSRLDRDVIPENVVLWRL
jgi:UDP-N-acetyl-D-galactosamine dehydrogenase